MTLMQYGLMAVFFCLLLVRIENMAYILNSHVVPSIDFFVRRYVDIHVGQDICTCQDNARRWLWSYSSGMVCLDVRTSAVNDRGEMAA